MGTSPEDAISATIPADRSAILLQAAKVDGFICRLTKLDAHVKSHWPVFVIPANAGIQGNQSRRIGQPPTFYGGEKCLFLGIY